MKYHYLSEPIVALAKTKLQVKCLRYSLDLLLYLFIGHAFSYPIPFHRIFPSSSPFSSSLSTSSFSIPSPSPPCLSFLTYFTTLIKQGDSLCAFCSRFKRGLLYSCCRTNGYNKLVLAQHLDDLVESFLMSALHNGQVRVGQTNLIEGIIK